MISFNVQISEIGGANRLSVSFPTNNFIEDMGIAAKSRDVANVVYRLTSSVKPDGGAVTLTTNYEAYFVISCIEIIYT